MTLNAPENLKLNKDHYLVFVFEQPEKKITEIVKCGWGNKVRRYSPDDAAERLKTRAVEEISKFKGAKGQPLFSKQWTKTNINSIWDQNFFINDYSVNKSWASE